MAPLTAAIPVKCISGHYGELVFGQKHKLDILLSPMIYNLPSFLHGHVANSLTCPRVMAAPENIKAGFLKEQDVFARAGHPLRRAVRVPRRAAAGAQAALRGAERRHSRAHPRRDPQRRGGRLCAPSTHSTTPATQGARGARVVRARGPAVPSVLARPYHMDPGIGHEIEVDLQAYGYPILWAQYLPIDPDLMDWAVRRRHPRRPHHARRSTSATSGRRPTAQHQRDPVGRQGRRRACRG